MKHRLMKYVMCLCGLIAMSQTSLASSTVKYEKRKPTPQHSSTNSILVQCFLSETRVKTSRAAVLQIVENQSFLKDLDIAITTGHGLIDEHGKIISGCEVRGPSGKTYSVEAIKLAPGFKPGTTADWAVLTFKKMHKEQVERYSVARDVSGTDIEKLAARNMQVLFSTARGVPQNGQNCDLFPRKYAGLTKAWHQGLLAHTCRAIPGQSGSPVSVVRDGRPVLLGIHIGNSFVLKVQGVEQLPRFYGYMRAVDTALLETLAGMMRDLEPQP